MLEQVDLAGERVPLDGGAAHLVTLTLSLHHFDDPLALLQEIERLLAPEGLFLLAEWDRMPFEEYLVRREDQPATMVTEERAALFAHYRMTNMFAAEDWRYLLRLGGFSVGASVELPKPFFAVLATRERGNGS